MQPMTDTNRSWHGRAFTVSIEAAEGVTTGISAGDRARTIAAAIEPDAAADDLVRPGHMLPIVARDCGRRNDRGRSRDPQCYLTHVGSPIVGRPDGVPLPPVKQATGR